MTMTPWKVSTDDEADEDTATPDTESCEDLDDWRVDSVYLSCSSYLGFEEDCGEYDTDYFDAADMCCACGGGSGEAATVPDSDDDSSGPPDPDAEDIELSGRWRDDGYSVYYTISNDAWVETPEWSEIPDEYRITFYDNTANYAIAKNGRTAPLAGRWSRFDWHVDSSGRYWYCHTLNAASTEAEAHTPPTEPAFPVFCEVDREWTYIARTW